MFDTSLPTLARSQDLEQLEQTWQRAVSDPSDVAIRSVAPFIDTLRILCESGSLGVAIKLGTQLIDSLDTKGRRADAIDVCRALIRGGALTEALAKRTFELLRAEYSDQNWYPLAVELSGIRPDNLTTDTFQRFERVRHYSVGNVVYHRAGWGEGLIEQFDPENRELSVRFVNGRSQEFPLSSALDSLRPLPDEDLRSMRLKARDELDRLAAEQPAVLIRKAVDLYRGRATSTQVKNELCPSVVPTKQWAGYWKRAKTEAANDPWLLIEGSSTRPTFELRKQPVSLTDEAERALKHATDIGEVIAVCRDYLARGLDDLAQRNIVELARQRVEAAIEKRDDSPAHLLDGILFLEQHGLQVSMSAAEELRELLSVGEDGRFDIRALDDLATQESKEHAITLIDTALGENWAQMCIDNIAECPASILEPLVDKLHAHERAHALVHLWEKIAPYPKRHPTLLFHLGRLYTEGVFDAHEQRPDVVTVGRVMMTLTRTVSAERKGDANKNRIRSRLTSLLTGRRALLDRCFDEISREDLAGYLQITERGGDDFPQEIIDATLRAVSGKYPDLTSKPERPFWDEDLIYVTAEGLARQREEYRVLVDEKIPANSKSIGNAAALGDLSENSEWEAAMEEQRNLTGRAQEMDQELRKARLLEDAEIPDDVAAPGTRVTYVNLETGRESSYRLLGPWDCIEDDILNYRAPLARGLLGRQVGDESTLPSADGGIRVRIEAIEKFMG